MADWIPREIAAGISLELVIPLTAYPAPTWSVALALRGPQSIDITATDDGTAHRLAVSAPTSTAWLPGRYWYTLRATDGTDTVEVESGQLQVKADLAAVSGPYDGRHHVEKVLDAIEAVIEGRATLDQERYRINNRELQRTPLDQLMKLRTSYQAELRRLKAARAGQSGLGRNVFVRF